MDLLPQSLRTNSQKPTNGLQLLPLTVGYQVSCQQFVFPKRKNPVRSLVYDRNAHGTGSTFDHTHSRFD